MSDDLKDLEEEIKPTPRTKSIIDIKPGWPWYTQVLAHVLNGIPIIIWVVIAYTAMEYFSQNPVLVHNRDMTMNISVWVTVWGLISEIAFLGLVSWAFIYFSHKRVELSAPIVQAACFVFWGLLAIAGAIIISAGIR